MDRSASARTDTSEHAGAILAWHALPARDAEQRLKSSPSGLSVAEAARRKQQYGPNALPEPPRRSLASIALAQFASPLIYLLLAAAVIALLLGEIADTVFIAIVLLINASIGGIQEWRAEANTAALRSSIKTICRVLRDGAVTLVDSADLVPGDVVVLEAGDRSPADLRLLESSELRVDESALTGESTPVDKAANVQVADDATLGDRTTMLYAGTSVQTGRGIGLVVATGHATEIGRIARALGEPVAPPPLTRRLERFSSVLGIVTVVVVALLMGIQILSGASWRETFFVAIALAVSAIPEGLPVAVTVALSIATARMARRHVIVRHLPAVEGLGACTVIASDKTGTLTVNELTATRLWLPGAGTIDVGGQGYDPDGDFKSRSGEPADRFKTALSELAMSGALCNDASFDPAQGPEGRSGDTVDIALLVLAVKAGVTLSDLPRIAPRVGDIPFAAERRFAASLNDHAGELLVHVKGAPEVILPRCAAPEALAEAERMAADGLRVLAIAARQIEDEGPFASEDIEEEIDRLELRGLVGFIDPLRAEAKEAVAQCRQAGISVRMVTGDHPVTALAIARDLGIARGADDVMTGREITALKSEPGDHAARIAGRSVFARVEPTQKVEIVQALQAAGNIVAVTGDGVNDAPALRRADLGVAMGRGGTDVARDAADLVLTDDNFASVVAGVEEGRAAYANIRKVIYLLISTGAAEVVLFILAIFTGLPVPLSAVQLLWLNLVTNGGQDVALAFERREPNLLKRPPRPVDQPIFDALMIRETVISGSLIGIVAYVFFAWALAQGWSEFDARNALLFLMVTFENVHVFNCRSEIRSAFSVPLRNNWPLMAAVVGAQGVHISAAYIPGLRDVLQMAPISIGLWLTLIPIALSVLLVMELAKAYWRRAGRSPDKPGRA